MSVIDRTPESVYLRGYGQYQLVDLKLTAGEMAGLASVFTCPSGTLPARFGGAAAVLQLAAALPFTILAAPGAAGPRAGDGRRRDRHRRARSPAL